MTPEHRPADLKTARIAGLTPEAMASALVAAHRTLWPERHMTREQAGWEGYSTTDTGMNGEWCSEWSADTLEELAEAVPIDLFGGGPVTR